MKEWGTLYDSLLPAGQVEKFLIVLALSYVKKGGFISKGTPQNAIYFAALWGCSECAELAATGIWHRQQSSDLVISACRASASSWLNAALGG